MPKSNFLLAAGDPERTVGLVYKDNSLSAGPATHVLVIGVASFQSNKYKKLLQTATISAREVADWFVDGAKARFTNPDCRLGSVALLLSEAVGATKAVYAGGEVPRATFCEAKAAVRAWVQRINTHKDNLAILYVASHGESFLNRTAFLFEDFGIDPLDATAGMSEVEQFVGAMENAIPIPQLLLFDCCRNPTDAQLPWNEVIGNKLIALTRRPDDHGESRKQWVICSTSLGDYAGGFATGPTLFNMALIEALNGVASDTTAEGWPVRPGLLVDKIDRILSLYRLPEEKAQTPAGRMAGSFDITFPGEPADVPVYIALDDPAEWPDSTITITVDGTRSDPITGAEGQSPFHLRRLPELAVIQVEAERHSASLGSAKAKVRAPGIFLEIEKNAVSFTTEVGRIPVLRGADSRAQLVINVDSPTKVLNGAVASIVRRDAPGEQPKEIVVDLGGETTIDLGAGTYVVTLRTPDGSIQTREVGLEKNQIVRVQFATQRSPHEWMSSATIAGAFKAPAAEAVLPEGPSPFLEHAHIPINNAATRHSNISVEIAGRAKVNLEIQQIVDVRMSMNAGPDDGRFVRFDVRDETPSRFLREESSAWIPPVFARIKSEGRVELAVIPSLGNAGPSTIGGWTPSLLVDRRAARTEPLTTIIVEDQEWAGLLGFLGSRDFAMGAKLLDSGLGHSAIAAMEDKLSNPLAAIAGALIAVAAASPDVEKRWDPWLKNIANWFHGIPDGPIVLGRRLLMRARTEEDIAEARKWFIEGHERGAPFYSLSVDWLARGLESIPGDDSSLAEMRASARQLSNRVDPTHTFTVIRISN
jgi:hypothetical protein